jgi:hypothetical protein
LKVEDLGLVAAALAPAQVHAQQHLGPVLRFEASGARMDLEDRVPRIVLAAQKLLQFELIDGVLDLRHLGLQLGEALGVPLFREFEEELRLVDRITLLLPTADGGSDLRVLAVDLLGALGLVPEVGGGDQVRELGGPLLECREVKDASRWCSRARSAPEPARAGSPISSPGPFPSPMPSDRT